MKYGQQRLAAGRKNFIFFLCPLDGEQFKTVPCFLSRSALPPLVLHGDQALGLQLIHRIAHLADILPVVADAEDAPGELLQNAPYHRAG